MQVAAEAGLEPTFLGAHRIRGLQRQELHEGFRVRRLGPYYPMSGHLSYFLGTPLFVARVGIELLRLRPQLVHASDVEAMMGVVLFQALGGRARVVFNIHDNFSLRNNASPLARRGMARVERWLGARADVVLVPDETRLELLAPWQPANAVVVPNVPSEDPGYAPRVPGRVLRLFVGGWLSWLRGFRELGELMASRPDTELVVCGFGPDDVTGFVRELPRTTFLGQVTQREALQAAASCDLAVALYDPQVELNRYASPNKVFDALSVGRPLIINREAQIARMVERERVGFVVTYGDVAELCQLLDHLAAHPEDVDEAGRRARLLFEQRYTWESVKPRVIQALIGGLNGSHDSVTTVRGGGA